MPSTQIAIDPASSPPKPAKERPISKRMQKVLSLIATKGMTQREAAKQGGMSETYLSTALRKPEIGAFIARKCRETIQIGTLRASNRVLELIDAQSEHVSLDASKHVLAIEGIRPPDQGQVSVNVGVSVGYVLDWSGGAPQQPVTTIDAQLTRSDVGHE
jgi:hypothetical protein